MSRFENSNFNQIGNLLKSNGINVMYPPAPFVGAKGDYLLPNGTINPNPTDDTQTIQNLINAFATATNTSNKINGGKLYFNKAYYKISNTISLHRGIHIIGESRESTQIRSFSPGSVFQYLDIGSEVQDEILIENISIWQDPSVPATSGAAVECSFGPSGSQSQAIICRNMNIGYTYRGILLEGGVWCSYHNINVEHAVTNGFEISNSNGTTTDSTTSVTFEACYAQICGQSGFKINATYYTSLISCASDSNAQYGYNLTNSVGVSLHACGGEENLGGGINLDTCDGIVINADIIYGIATGSIHGLTIHYCNNTTLLGGKYAGDTLTGGYGINISARRGKVLCVGVQFEGIYATNICNGQDYYHNLSGSSSMVGDQNHYAIGATIPDNSSIFQVGGFNADTTTNTGLKSNPYFNYPDALKNVAAYFQALINTTANGTFPLMAAAYIDSAGNGGGSGVIQRLAGLYVKEQLLGSTANADIMIDANVGTVPTGNWAIYSQSARPSLFKGPITLPTYTTATRPSGQQVATMIYDTTLNKPIWFNGTNWTDAMGNVV